MAAGLNYSDTVPTTTLVGPGGGVASGLTSGGTAMELSAAISGSISVPFRLRIEPGTTNEELVMVTGGAGTSGSPYTITRAQGTTTAKAHATGASVSHGISAHDFYDVEKGVVNVMQYGAKGDNSTDDATALAAAVAALPATGGILFFPPGRTFLCSTTLNFSGKANVIIQGHGGRSAGAGTASRLIYTGGGSGSFLNFQSTFGTVIRDIQITHNGSFTGNMVDIRNTGSGDPSYSIITNCYIGGNSSNRTSVLVNLDKATRVCIDNCAFYDAAVCVIGKSVNANYSNQVTIRNCGFNTSPVAIKNPDQAWTVLGCVFEGSAAGVAGAMTHDVGVVCAGLTVMGCWTGDITSGTQFVVAGKAITFQGNWIGATTANGINVDEITNGLIIEGNHFQSATTAVTVFSSGSNTGQRILHNSYSGVTTKLSTGGLSAGAIEDCSVANTVSIYAASINGLLTMTDGNNIAVASATGTKIGTATTQKIGFFNATPVVQQNTTGTSTGFTAGAGTTATSLSTFTGNLGATAYTVGDVVRALKTLGLMAQ